MEAAELKSIALEKIYPHPDNPRKDLGDLTELTESIRKNGIMQNLTVMPGHYKTKTELDDLAEQYAETHDEAILKKIAEGWSEDGYTLLIGHRRAAAARAAGMTVVPCTVVRAIDRKEQVGIMLEENMQRTDLTIREQAQGFQMMLDLGDTIETVAKKTGFSKATIKHRIEIAKLDPKAIAKAEDGGYYQISIGDFLKLEKLPTVEMRNEVLRDARDGRQLDYKINFMLEKIQRDEKKNVITEKIKALGVKQAPERINTWNGDWIEEKRIPIDEAKKAIGKIEKPEECVFTEEYNAIRILRKNSEKKEKQLSEFDKEQNWNKKRRKRCREIQKDMDERRRNFILRIANRDVMPAPEDHEKMIIEELLAIGLSGEAFLSKAGIIEYFAGRDRWSMSADEKKETEERIAGMATIAKLMMAIDRFFAMRTGTDAESLISYDGTKNEERAELLRRFYRLMQNEYGFVPEREDGQIMNLTHEVFESYKEAKELGKV